MKAYKNMKHILVKVSDSEIQNNNAIWWVC